MRPGSTVIMSVVIPAAPGRMRYETFNRNRGTITPVTYNRQGTVRWIDWKTRTATVKWANGSTSKESLSTLKEMEHKPC